MKQRQPGFFDSPQVWSAIASVAVGVVIVLGHTVHGTPYSPYDLTAIVGAGFMAWVFALFRFGLLFPED